MKKNQDTFRKRVLSIQSHVVSGYVGNKAATFPLQVLGFDVDAVNSVQLSNHTGYKSIEGQVLKSEELKALYKGLADNNIDDYSYLLTGYCGDASFLKEILNVFQQLKAKNKNLMYVCDPVMGDNGKFYVPENLLPIYRDDLLPCADIVTPNQFEAELLTGITIGNEKTAFQAMETLHAKGPKIVVLTSTDIGGKDQLLVMASHKDRPKEYIRLEVARLDATFTGTGDLFTSMLMAWLHQYPDDVKLCCEKTMSAIQTILEATLSSALEMCGEGEKPTSGQIELRLVQSLDVIRNPELKYQATCVTVP